MNQASTQGSAEAVAEATADANGRVVWAVIRAAHDFEDRLELALGAHELSVAKFGVLDTLRAAGEPLTLTELANRLQCVRSNVTQMVDRLEADLLVKREDDPSDRRSIRAVLTSKGLERAQQGSETVARVQNEIASGLNAADQITFSRLLSGLG